MLVYLSYMTQSEITELRKLFPILEQKVHNKPLVYLDNAASTHKPLPVLNAIQHYYTTTHSNVHRGVHKLSQLATEAYEGARETLRAHLNAKNAQEIIFTKGCTEAINTVAHGFGQFLKAGDEILVSHLEHHSNIVPWQMACERSGALLKVIPMNNLGELLWSSDLVNSKTKLIAVNHVSNALGTINPIKTICQDAHANQALVLVDGAQAGPHFELDVQDLDVDFYALSGHKIYGPTGIGVLYGKQNLLNWLPPYQGGGDMIKTVSFEKTTYADLPFKFEAGTPNIAGAVGLAEAIRFVNSIGLARIAEHENHLLKLATQALSAIQGLKIYGTSVQKAGVLSFLIGEAHPYDTGVLLDHMGIAIRTGHHCTQPIMSYFQIPGTARASFALYNTEEEIEWLAKGVKRAAEMLN